MGPPSVRGPPGSLRDKIVVVLPSEGRSCPAVEDIQSPDSVLEEVGAGTGHWEEVAQVVHPVCVLAEARVRHQVHSVWWVVAGGPVIQAAE